MAIKCCRNCVPPARYPGCHDKCNKYLEEKAKWEEAKDKARCTYNNVLYPSDFEMLACMHRVRKYKRRK